jgi:hypothetical protein
MVRRQITRGGRFNAQARDLPGSERAITAAAWALAREVDFSAYPVVAVTPSGSMRALKTLPLAAHAQHVIYFVEEQAGVLFVAIIQAEPLSES